MIAMKIHTSSCALNCSATAPLCCSYLKMSNIRRSFNLKICFRTVCVYVVNFHAIHQPPGVINKQRLYLDLPKILKYVLATLCKTFKNGNLGCCFLMINVFVFIALHDQCHSLLFELIFLMKNGPNTLT
jgi:hypothetical protein